MVSTSIDKYLYVTFTQKFGKGVSVRYRNHESCDHVEDLAHNLIRETLLHYDIHDSVELVIISDVPASGSGLGASSALTCALVAVLERYKGQDAFDPAVIAEIASKIEIDKVGSPIGKQDQYASAFGGFNQIQFNEDDSVEVRNFESQDFINEIESQSMLFYLNIEHTYHSIEKNKTVTDFKFVPKILREQVATIEKNKNIHRLQRDNAVNLWDHMKYEVPERFIDHVNENWRLKRSSHPEISSPEIDSIIQRAYKAGATAAKVCGAGGGGFVYFMVPHSMQDDVRKELSELHELKFKFEDRGVEVIFEDSQRSGVAV